MHELTTNSLLLHTVTTSDRGRVTAEKGARIRKAIGGLPLVAAVVVACLALSTQGCAGARGMGTSNTAINYVTILGSGPEMQPSCCVSTSKVICRYRVCRR